MRCNICDINMKPIGKDLHKCPLCELVSSDLEPDLSIYDKSYNLKYQRYSKTTIGDSITRFRYKTLCLTANLDHKLLDFGCGSGIFVDYCIQNGVEAVGYDVNPYSQYSDIINLLNGHKIVTFWDSLEHVRDPYKLVERLNAVTVLVSAPSTDDCKTNLYDWHHYYPREHVHYFNEKSLKKLLTQLGYKIKVVSYEESRYRQSGGYKNILTIGGVRG